MAFACSPDGTLYAVGQLNVTNPDFNSLYRVDRETGLATRIGSTGVLDPSVMITYFGPVLSHLVMRKHSIKAC